MSGAGLARTAITNSLHSMSRTLLTVVAIFIGAFTLTLTTGVGHGINAYIDNTTSSIGSSSSLNVTKKPQTDGSGPQRYTGTVVKSSNQGPVDTVDALTPSDLTKMRAEDGVNTVEPVLPVTSDYIVYNGSRKYQLSTVGYVKGTSLKLLAGAQPDPESATRQIALPNSFLDPLDITDAPTAIDKIVTIGITDAKSKQTTVTAKVVAVTQSTLANTNTASINDALAKVLYDRQSVGLSTTNKQKYASATVTLDDSGTAANVDTVKKTLSDDGYKAQTVSDQIGDFKTVIDAIVLVLNGFAILALLAAGLGIVNTLLMSVRERTREIGLMKAMGLGGGSIFTMFSMEALFIGLLGSAVGAGAAILAGTIINGILAGGVLSGLAGLTLLVFSPTTILGIIALVMAIAFVAGSIPALKAARQDPIESLRYE